MAERKHVVIYTEGVCAQDPGPGGWSCVLTFGGHRKELNGSMPDTTRERMAMFAVISGLGALKEPCDVTVHCASAALCDAFASRRIQTWMKTGWVLEDGTRVPNHDLWFILMAQTRKHHVTFLAGQAEKEEKQRCGELARAAIAEYREWNSPHDEEGNPLAASSGQKAAGPA